MSEDFDIAGREATDVCPGRVLVTGATGFIGKHLVEALRGRTEVVAAVRSVPGGTLPPGMRTISFDLEHPARLSPDSLKGVGCVCHLAARVHVMHPGPDDERRFLELNARATEVLAETAARAGVRRFVYVSSIKVNGERTVDAAFRADGPTAPEDGYSRSKLEAERALWRVAERNGLEVAVVRPPLVYGPGVGANFQRLVALVESGWPLPFGLVRNRRSLVSVWNLTSLLIRLMGHPEAAGRAWLVSDGDDLSTPRLLDEIAKGLGQSKSRLLPVPVGVLRALGAVTGRRGEIGRLTDSLQVDISDTCALLAWRPPLSVQEGIARTARWFRTRAPR